ncbi:MAG: hypothetical protein JW895_00650 [Thermoleophilaceae bacterium]|nr:hypothetical protein [Thermoleophilaceae bacterium]
MGRWPPAVLLALVVTGGWALLRDLDGIWIAVAALPLLVFAALRRAGGPPFLRAATLALGLIAVPVFALLGVDWIWARLTDWRPDALLSLVLGGVLVGLAAWIYLHPWWVASTPRRPVVWAALLALGLVAVPPAVLWAAGALSGDESSLEQRRAVVSRLDVIVLSDGDAPPDSAAPSGWRVSTWRGQVGEGDRIRWGPEGPPPVVPREDTDRVLLLVPTAAPADDEVERWLGLADRVASTFTPTYALLPSAEAERLAAWRGALKGHAPGARRGGAVARGSGTATELALRLAVLSPDSDSDLALAVRHRPALFFDRGEPYPVPLNVDGLMASGKLRLCEQGQAVEAACTAVDDAADLRNGATHLRFDPDDLAALTDASTIYVHVTRAGNDHPNSIYLDYWWYFPHNPAGAGGGALCGAGFVVAGITCFDHQSDWEGVTVVLDADSPSGTPTAVTYAQHGRVTRYTWPALERLWDDGDRVNFGRGVDTGARPLVFVARGTHASYPTSCEDERCEVGDLPGSPAKHPTRENRHDGRVRADCPSVCVAALPVRAGGREPALWNAFDGGWGTSDCVLEVFCSASPPPRSPGFQGRYRHPWCATEAVAWRRDRFTRSHPACTGRRPTASEITGNERLLALGDSFSSGQGAGSYDPGTNGGGNTCFRSPDAWPQELARRLDLAALPSLACSGAVSRDVRFGRPGGERERRLSQIGRVDGDPGVVTITIGGNDVGFAGVLKDCLLANCVTKYHRPSGDVLEARIAALAERLPGVYEDIRAAAPRARVVVAGYPRLFPGRERWGAAGDCLMRQRISGAEVDYLNALTPALNAAIAGAAKQAGVEFVDVTEAFDRHELRCRGETARTTYLQPLQDAISLIPASFHPNAAGHERLAEVVAGRL